MPCRALASRKRYRRDPGELAFKFRLRLPISRGVTDGVKLFLSAVPRLTDLLLSPATTAQVKSTTLPRSSVFTSLEMRVA
ncbi:hypothetical protein KCP77_19450 [Salmonella enterica subsp. enterica]|nr:hypothetical protein KCP77_19450 [Salmonella enterica subsp. enterica]